MPDSSTSFERRYHVRWMIRRDMPEVLLIERCSTLHPWTEEDFLRCLRRRNCIGMVAEQGEQVVGFMIYELWRKKLALLNFAVHPEFWRRGVGSRLIRKLASKLFSHRRTHIQVDVRETNLAVQLFLQRQGFQAVGIARALFEDSGEDAYTMVFWLPGALPSPADDEIGEGGK